MKMQELESILKEKQKKLPQIIASWQKFMEDFAWETYIKQVNPKVSGNGLVYELPNFLEREHESFAIVDMRAITFSEPHYHIHEIEIYMVLQGSASIIKAGEEFSVTPGSVLVTHPHQAHFTIPDNNFIMAIVNIPSFSTDRYIPLLESDCPVGFNKEQLQAFIKSNY